MQIQRWTQIQIEVFSGPYLDTLKSFYDIPFSNTEKVKFSENSEYLSRFLN